MTWSIDGQVANLGEPAGGKAQEGGKSKRLSFIACNHSPSIPRAKSFGLLDESVEESRLNSSRFWVSDGVLCFLDSELHFGEIVVVRFVGVWVSVRSTICIVCVMTRIDSQRSGANVPGGAIHLHKSCV